MYFFGNSDEVNKKQELDEKSFLHPKLQFGFCVGSNTACRGIFGPFFKVHFYFISSMNEAFKRQLQLDFLE